MPLNLVLTVQYLKNQRIPGFRGVIDDARTTKNGFERTLKMAFEQISRLSKI